MNAHDLIVKLLEIAQEDLNDLDDGLGDGTYEQDVPALRAIIKEAEEWLAAEQEPVIITVHGGIGYIQSAPNDVRVEVRDYDEGKDREDDDPDVERDEDEYGQKYVVTDVWDYGKEAAS